MGRRTERCRRPLVGTLSALAAGAVLAACGSGQPSATRPSTSTSGTVGGSSTTTTVQPAATVPPSSSAATSSSTPTSSSATGTGVSTGTSAGSGATACSSGVLLLREDGLSAAAGTSHVTYVLTNEGPQPCHIDGYPSVALFGPSGAGGAGAGPALAIRSFELGRIGSGLTLAHGGAATFVLSVSEVPVNGAGCQQAGSLQVTPPGAAAALSVRAGYAVCGGTVGIYPLSAAG